MSEPVRILVVPGSLRSDSLNRRLGARAAQLVPAGAEAVVFDGLAAVPPFDEDSEPQPPQGTEEWRGAIRASDALLFATPEYNASIPGQLKNAVDWASRADSGADPSVLARSALYGRPVAVVSASTGQFGAVWAADELRKVLRTAGARVVAEPVVAVPSAGGAFRTDGSLAPAVEDRLVQLLEGLVSQVRQLRAAGVQLIAS